ncbi:hypothetical protein TNCV_867791 [Trichonephila clavipes]|nr:hypothetical protein TNCV_867791 [Trichonephila clavipes]
MCSASMEVVPSCSSKVKSLEIPRYTGKPSARCNVRFYPDGDEYSWTIMQLYIVIEVFKNGSLKISLTSNTPGHHIA